MTNKIKISFLLMASVAFTMSCKKNNEVIDKDPISASQPAAQFFLTDFTQGYALNQTKLETFVVPVKVTNVANVDRVVNFTYTSTSGAQIGTHYNAPTSLTIKAGQTGDSLRIVGIYTPYANGRIDTVKVKITNATFSGLYGKDSINLIIQRSCDVVLTDLEKAYDSTYEYSNPLNPPSYGPYTTSVIGLTATGATTATGMFSNLYDDGWNDISFDMDYTSASKFKITIPLQSTGKAYGGATSSSVRSSAGKVNTFSSCDKTFTITIDIVNDATGVATTANYRMTLK